MDRDLVVVYSGNFGRAGYVKGLLEHAGIPAYVQDEAMSTMHPTVGVARVQVAKESFDKASVIVQRVLDEEAQSRTSPSKLKSKWIGKGFKNDWVAIITVASLVLLISLAIVLLSRK